MSVLLKGGWFPDGVAAGYVDNHQRREGCSRQKSSREGRLRAWQFLELGVCPTGWSVG